MSIATLKRKTNEKYKTASHNQTSFSINGTGRKEMFGIDMIPQQNAPSSTVSTNILRQYHTPQYNHVKEVKIQDRSQGNRIEQLKKSIIFESSNKTFATKCNESGTNRNAYSTVKDTKTMSSSELLQRRAFKKATVNR
jgi:hypothetical protein